MTQTRRRARIVVLAAVGASLSACHAEVLSFDAPNGVGLDEAVTQGSVSSLSDEDANTLCTWIYTTFPSQPGPCPASSEPCSNGAGDGRRGRSRAYCPRFRRDDGCFARAALPRNRGTRHSLGASPRTPKVAPATFLVPRLLPVTSTESRHYLAGTGFTCAEASNETTYFWWTQLPPDDCVLNLRHSPCAATVASLEQCVSYVAANYPGELQDGAQAYAVCKPFLSAPSCDETVFQSSASAATVGCGTGLPVETGLSCPPPPISQGSFLPYGGCVANATIACSGAGNGYIPPAGHAGRTTSSTATPRPRCSAPPHRRISPAPRPLWTAAETTTSAASPGLPTRGARPPLSARARLAPTDTGATPEARPTLRRPTRRSRAPAACPTPTECVPTTAAPSGLSMAGRVITAASSSLHGERSASGVRHGAGELRPRSGRRTRRGPPSTRWTPAVKPTRPARRWPRAWWGRRSRRARTSRSCRLRSNRSRTSPG